MHEVVVTPGVVLSGTARPMPPEAWGGQHVHCLARDGFEIQRSEPTRRCGHMEGLRAVNANTADHTLRLTGRTGGSALQEWETLQDWLNALGHRDGGGRPLVEEGVRGANTYAAPESAGLGPLPDDAMTALEKLDGSTLRSPPTYRPL